MFARCDRRQFLHDSARLAAGAALAPCLVRLGSAAPSPVKPMAGCRDVMLPKTDMTDCWKAAQSVGAESLELTIQDDLSLAALFHPETKYSLATPEDVKRLASDVKAAGLRVGGFCMANRFEERPDFELEWCGKVAQGAAALGCKAVRIDIRASKRPNDELIELLVPLLKKLIAQTASTGVAFGIENHGRVTNDPDVLQALFDGVGSPRLGLTLDTGNFYWYGHPLSKLYQLFERFAPRVVHTHCKSIQYPEELREQQRTIGLEYAKRCCPIDQGDIDFRRVVSILEKAGYANDLCIENESLKRFPEEQRGPIVALEIAYLKSLR